jgi:predicted transposase/invertase (TIGR01784 family)
MVRSEYISDIIIGGLCRIKDEDRYVERLLSAIRNLSENERKDAIKKALTLLRLRPILHSKVEKRVKEESMPLTIVEVEKDPYYKKGIRRGVRVGLKRGIKKGIEREKVETARRLYKMGLSLERISEAVNLPLDEVRRVLYKS